jgi:hypothetical protein
MGMREVLTGLAKRRLTDIVEARLNEEPERPKVPAK